MAGEPGPSFGLCPVAPNPTGPEPRQTRDDHPHSLSWAIHSKLSQGINLRWLGKLGPRAPSLEPAWLMIKGHHPRRVARQAQTQQAQTRGGLAPGQPGQMSPGQLGTRASVLPGHLYPGILAPGKKRPGTGSEHRQSPE